MPVIAAGDCIALHPRPRSIAGLRFLLHGKLPDTTADDLTARGHTPVAADEAGIRADDSPQEVLAAARLKQLDIITADRAFAAAAYDVKRSIIFLASTEPGGIKRLFDRFKRLAPGQLYTVNAGSVKVRQLPYTSPSTNNQ